MATRTTPRGSTASKARSFFDTYTRDITREEVQRLFKRDTREAYQYLSRDIRPGVYADMKWYERVSGRAHELFLAFTMKLSPARRLIYAVALVASLIGLIELFTGFDLRWAPAGPYSIPLIVPTWRDGTVLLLVGFFLLNLLVILEVADRLSLKNDLEIARDIQKQMLPREAFRAEGIEVYGLTRPANTVGGDFYEISPQADGRLVIAVGDVAGKGSPAALLMALLLAIMRTLLDEGMEAAPLMERLNLQIARHSPSSRFITLFFAVIDPRTGDVVYVNAGHLPPIVRRRDGTFTRLAQGGIALGLSRKSKYAASADRLETGDVLVLYSDGITEAESEAGVAFDEAGIEHILSLRPDATAPDLSRDVFAAVEQHVGDQRLADDLTVLVARRLPPLPDQHPPLSP